jgi:hypothetical protein
MSNFPRTVKGGVPSNKKVKEAVNKTAAAIKANLVLIELVPLS